MFNRLNWVMIFSLLLLLSVPSMALANSPSNISALDAETDGVNGFTTLDRATGVDTFTIGSSTYAIVASVGDDGVQIINISDPSNIVATDAETDGVNGFTELDDARSADTFTIGTSTYAIVTAYADDGVQIINISDPSNISALDAETDGVNGFTELDGPNGVDIFTIGTSTYAIVTSYLDDGVQIINISDPSNIVATDAETDGVNGFTELDGAFYVDTFTIGSSTYAIVAAIEDDGVQIINISDPSNIVAVDAETDGSNGFTDLDQARNVDTFTIGSSTYAIVVSFDDGVQMIDISDPSNIVAVDAEIDGSNGFTTLDGAFDVDTFTIGSSTYAIVTATRDDGVQMIDISDPSNIVAVDAETDGSNGFTELDRPRGVDVFTIGTSTYAIVVSFEDDGVQMINISENSDGGGGDYRHKTRPTFGLNHDLHFQLVEGGFRFNDVQIDITDNFWTPFEQQSINVGEINEFEATVYAPKKLQVQEFLFGIPAVGESHKAELGVEVFYNRAQEIEGVRLVQETDIVDLESIQITKTNSKCAVKDPDELCISTVVQMRFLEPLQDDIMAIKAIDFKKRTNITYLNDGFRIVGDSLNPMKTMMIPGTEKYEGLIEITQTAKYSNVWVASDGRAFEINEYGTPKLISQTAEDKAETKKNIDRYHSEFPKIKKSQVKMAMDVMSEYCPTCGESFADFDDSWSFDFAPRLDRIEKLAIMMDAENQKAIRFLVDRHLDTYYPGVEIDVDDRPISEILAEERALKKILADERAHLKQTFVSES